MSSEPDLTLVEPDEKKSEPEPPQEDISPRKKSPGEHAKGRRRKRGQKNKQRKGATAHVTENHEDSGALATGSPAWDSDQDLDEINCYSDVIIRPVNVPKAPENSTQFIIDDHNECRLYMSFETPNPYISDPPKDGDPSGVVIEPVDEEKAYVDIDWEYVSPRDIDQKEYYSQDFELSYKSNRIEELLRLPRTELIAGLQSLETKLEELTEQLLREDSTSILEKLQEDLLMLQDQNILLKESNTRLNAKLMDVNPEEDVSIDSSMNVDSLPSETSMEEVDSSMDRSAETPKESSEQPHQSPSVDSNLDERNINSNMLDATIDEQQVNSGECITNFEERDVNCDEHNTNRKEPRVSYEECDTNCEEQNVNSEARHTSRAEQDTSEAEMSQNPSASFMDSECQNSVINSCGDGITVSDQSVRRTLVFGDDSSCEEEPSSTVADKHELSAVTV